MEAKASKHASKCEHACARWGQLQRTTSNFTVKSIRPNLCAARTTCQLAGRPPRPPRPGVAQRPAIAARSRRGGGRRPNHIQFAAAGRGGGEGECIPWLTPRSWSARTQSSVAAHARDPEPESVTSHAVAAVPIRRGAGPRPHLPSRSRQLQELRRQDHAWALLGLLRSRRTERCRCAQR
jgi:hypothetical protein